MNNCRNIMTGFYISYRIIDGKPKWVVVDKNGDITNRNPNKAELKGLEIFHEKDGRSRPKPNVSYKDEELLEFLRMFEREEGRSPTVRDFYNNPKYPNANTYIRRFGGWNKAIEMAGFRPIESRGYQYIDEELLEFLRRFERENGRSPKEEDFNNNPEYPGPKTYQRHFGSWNDALRMSGLQVNVFTNCTEEELLQYLRQFSREKGRSPEVLDFNNNSKYPSFSAYRRRFGNWNNALRMAGLQINVFTNCTDEELLEYLTKFYEEKRRPPTIEDFIGNGKYPSFKTYQDRFGGWQKALRLVELDTDSMIRKGIVETDQQKGRQAEMYILENDEKGAADLSGENSGSFADGISRISKGQIYDVKSSKLHEKKYWSFCLNKCIDFYYLLGYDKDHKNLLYKWKIPGDFTEGTVVIGNNNCYTYNIENMKEFEISL